MKNLIKDTVAERIREKLSELTGNQPGLVFVNAPDAAPLLMPLLREYSREAGAELIETDFNREPCVEPYAPFTTAVRLLMSGVSRDAADDIFRRARVYSGHSAVLRDLVAGIPLCRNERLILEEIGYEKWELIRSVMSLLTAAAGSRRLVLFLNGIHNADSSTVEFLIHFFRNKPMCGILVVGFYEYDELQLRSRTDLSELFNLIMEHTMVSGTGRGLECPAAACADKSLKPEDALVLATNAYCLLAFEHSLRTVTGCLESPQNQNMPEHLQCGLLGLAADNYLALGDYNSALTYYNRQLGCVQGGSQKRLLARIYSRIGYVEYLRVNNESAIRYANISMDLCSEDTSELCLEIYLSLFHAYEQLTGIMTDFHSIYSRIFLKLVNNCRVLNFQNTLAHVLSSGLYMMSVVRLKDSPRDTAVDYCGEAIEIYRKIGNRQGLTRAYNTLGMLYQFLENYKEAMTCYRRAEQMSRARNDILERARLINGTGFFYFTIGYYQEAYRNFRKVLLITDGTAFFDQIGGAFYNIAKTLIYTTNYSKAVNYLENTIALLNALKKEDFPYHPRINIYSLLGICCMRTGREAEASELACRVENLRDYRNNAGNFPYYELLKGMISLSRGDRENAVISFQNAIKLKDREDFHFELFYHWETGQSWNKSGFTALCRKCWRAGLQLLHGTEQHSYYRSLFKAGLSGQELKPFHRFQTVRINLAAVIERARKTGSMNELQKKMNEINFLHDFQGLFKSGEDQALVIEKALKRIGVNFLLDQAVLFIENGNIWQAACTTGLLEEAVRMSGRLVPLLASGYNDAVVFPSGGLPVKGGVWPGLGSCAVIPCFEGTQGRKLFLYSAKGGESRFQSDELKILSILSHQLAASMDKMDSDRRLLAAHQELKKRNEIVENELTIARRIQMNMVPLKSGSERIAFVYQPMDMVGGDFFDFISYPVAGQTGFFISDVSGHGVPAALITSMIKTILQQVGPYLNDPSAILEHMNEALIGQVAGNFITALYGIYYSDSREFHYANAGHNMPLVIEKGTVRTIQSQAKSLPLAIMGLEEMGRSGRAFKNEMVRLEKGSKLILYTDGLTEAVPARSSSGAVVPDFEESRLKELVRNISERPAALFVQDVMDALTEFRGSGSFEDDVCLICLDVD